MSYTACPDCSAHRGHDNRLTHDDTCPLGLGYDMIQVDDRIWFDERPHVNERRRPPHWAEITELRLVGILPPAEVGEVCGDVVVTRIAPGLRAKRFDDLWIAVTS